MNICKLMANKILPLAVLALCLGALSGCTETQYVAHVVKQIPMPGEKPRSKSVGSFKVGSAYTIKGRRYHPQERYNYTQNGVASWYGPGFHGKKTANGEIFDKNELTAAHKTLQLPSIIRVTNLSNGRSIILRVNDRGPFAHDRILDVSERGSVLLGFKNNGTARIKLEVLPQESRQVASAAKAGRDTRGFEVALNQNKIHSHSISRSPQTITPRLKPASPTPPRVTQVAYSSPQQAYQQQPVPLRKPLPVESAPLPATKAIKDVNQNARIYAGKLAAENLKSGKIFVQAGSFSQEQNALALSNRLETYGTSKVYLTRINNQPFFRVRLGPYPNTNQARQIVSALNESGNRNAAIVID